MRYVAKLHQPHGCDYTIECGTKIVELKSSTVEEALHEVRKIVIGVDEDDPEYNIYGLGCRGEYQLDSVRLYEVTQSIDIPIAVWYEQGYRFLESQRVERARRKKRELLEGLSD